MHFYLHVNFFFIIVTRTRGFFVTSLRFSVARTGGGGSSITRYTGENRGRSNRYDNVTCIRDSSDGREILNDSTS